MRITGGTKRGKRLASLSKTGKLIRPTSDKARQAIFNILGDKVINSRVLDLYAGTGALGIEALSRGADFAVFIDQERMAGEIIHQNLASSFKKPRAFLFVHQLPSKFLQRIIYEKMDQEIRFDLIFLDPPYNKDMVVPTIKNLLEADIIAPKAVVVAEEDRKVALPETIASLTLTDSRTYGEAGIWFYSPQ